MKTKLGLFIFIFTSLAVFGSTKSDLFRACLSGETSKFFEIFQKEGLKTIFEKDQDGNTLLHLSCCSKKGGHKKELVKCLIDAGADVNATNKYGSTPLFIALTNKNIEAVDLLVHSENININKTMNNKFTPLHVAILSESIPLVKLILSSPKINPNFGTPDGATPLHYAAMNGLIEESRILISDQRTDVNAQQHDPVYGGATPLHFAAMQAQTEIVKLLLATNNIDTNVQLQNGDYRGFSPVHFAVLNPDTPNVFSVIKELINAGVPYNKPCASGKKPIDLTSVKIIQDLLRNPKKVTAKK